MTNSDSEIITTEETLESAPTSSRKRTIAMIILTIMFVLMGILWFLYWLKWGQFEQFTDDAYVSGNMVPLMPQVSGTVTEVLTEDTQLVTEGQVLVKLDRADYEIALQRAKADLGQTVRQVRQYFENADQAKQNVIVDKADLLSAKLDLQRRQALTGNRAVSREEMQHYKTTFESAEARYKASQFQLDSALALIANSELYTHPLVEASKANLRAAYLNYQRTIIRAPITGFVAQRNVYPGQQVGPQSALLSIIPLNDTWVDANYKESSLNDLRVNQPVTLYADAYPEVAFHGRVVGLNAGTGSVFSLLPPQNATGNWIKIVQRLPVRISLNPDELKKTPLQLGLSMRVTVNTRSREGSRMQEVAKVPVQLETTIFQKQLADVETLINKILISNSDDRSLSKSKPSRAVSSIPKVEFHG